MRKAAIYYKDFLAGILTETDDGDYTFQYDENFIAEHPKESISLTMPVRTISRNARKRACHYANCGSFWDQYGNVKLNPSAVG